MNLKNLIGKILQHIDYQERKHINSKTKSNKILFEDENKWVLIDTQEFLQYMKDNTIKVVVLDELINGLEWNIILPKN